MRNINKKWIEKKFLINLVIILITIPLAMAANDPGHDTLYIEEDGDSELNGSLNITYNLTVKGGNLFMNDYLDIYADGATIDNPSINTIAGTNTYLAIDSPGDVFINRYSNDGMVYLGHTGDTVNLNVTGALYIQGSTATIGGTNICLENGTNCPSELGGANITGSGADNRVAFWTDGDTLSYDGNLTWNRSANRLGIGTSSPGYNLDVSGDIYLSKDNPILYWGNAAKTNTGTYITEAYGLEMYGASNLPIQIMNAALLVGYDATGGDYGTTGNLLVAGNVGINTTSPNTTLHVDGQINATGDICEETSGNCLSSVGSGSGNITGNGNSGYLAKFTAAGVIADSIVSESGNTLSIAGNISMPTSFYIGSNAVSTGADSIAIGTGARSINSETIAIGQNANATNTRAIAIGYNSDSTGDYTIAIGYNSKVNNTRGIGIGFEANAGNQYAVAIGEQANAQAAYSIAIGTDANATGDNSISLGVVSDSIGDLSIAIGDLARATQDYAVAIGYKTNATAQDAYAFGRGIENNVQNSTLFGGHVRANGDINTTSGDICIVGGNCLSDMTAADGNNYTEAISFSGTGTITLNLDRVGMANLTAQFTDTDTTIGNCSGDQTCLGVLYDSNASDFMASGTDNWLDDDGDTATGNYTFGSTALHIDDTNDRVGIGTAAPTETLEITSGNVFLDDASSIIYFGAKADNYGAIQITSHNLNIGSFRSGQNAAQIKLNSSKDGSAVNGSISLITGTNGAIATRLFVDSSGFIGIGTSTPEDLVDIRNTAGDATLAVAANNNENATIKLLESAGIATDYGGWMMYKGVGNTFQIGTINNSIPFPVIYIPRSSTTVGINTTSPNTTLHVHGDINATGDICEETTGICLSTAGSGSGNITGNGNSGYLAKFTAAGVIADSIVSESGNTLSIAGNISMPTSFYIGSNAVSTGADSIAIGTQASATAIDAIAIGDDSTAAGIDAISVGDDSDASHNYSIAIGSIAQATGSSSTATGRGAEATGPDSVALGRVANATGNQSTALGSYSDATYTQAIAIGYGADANSSNAIAIGAYVDAWGSYAIGIGEAADALGGDSIAIGQNSDALNGNTIAIGEWAIASGSRAVAISLYANATADYSISIGDYSDAKGQEAIAIGQYAFANNTEAIAIGSASDSTGLESVAIGDNAQALGNYAVALGPNTDAVAGAIAIGRSANSSQSYDIAIGNGAFSIGDRSIAMGDVAQATGDYSFAVGYKTNATAQDAYAFGRGIENNVQNSTLFGGHVRANGDINTTSGDICIVGGNCLSDMTAADGNNYTGALGMTGDATNYTMQLSRVGMANLTLDWNDRYQADTTIGNCSGDQTCLGVLYDTNASDFMASGTDNWLDDDGDTATGNYTFGSTALHIDDTNDRVGIGTAAPNSSLQVEGNISQNDNYYHCFGNNCDAYMYFNGTSLVIKVS